MMDFRSPGLFNSLAPVKEFLIEATNSLNLTDFNFSLLGGSIKINVKKVRVVRERFY